MKHSFHEKDNCPSRLTVIISIAVGLALAGYIAYSGLTLAEVQLSHATGECVRVIPTSAGTCDILPNRYAITWVK